jgi:hypothetical protein
MIPEDPAPSRRVAIVVVHGVADQKLGDTAQALADLMAAQTTNGATYERGVRSDVLLPVQPLEPIAVVQSASATLRKQARQSVGSDYLRNEGAASGAARRGEDKSATVSQGVEFTSYLLGKAINNKAINNEASGESYTMPVISLLRRDEEKVENVDVCEMYWADLSRLAGNIPTILTELFTFLFRLSTLGRDTVQTQAAAPQSASHWQWRLLSRCQTALDWMYSRILALLFLQLVMYALILIPFGIALQHQRSAFLAASALLVAVAGCATLYYARKAFLSLLAAVGVGLVMVFVYWLGGTMPTWIVGLTWLGILGLAYNAWLVICEERFPLVRPPGIVLGLASIAIVLYYAERAAQTDLEMWIVGALRGVEFSLAVIAFWWFISGWLFLVWLLAGICVVRIHASAAARESPEAATMRARAKATVGTGRMCLVVSIGFFVVLSMTAWALITTVVEKAVDGVPYEPIIFKVPVKTGTSNATSATPSVLASQPAPAQEGGNATKSEDRCEQNKEGAARFLCQRYVKSTETFALIAIVLAALAGYLMAMLGPSMVMEAALGKLEGESLGIWLTRGYRWMDRIMASLAVLCAVAAFLIGTALLAYRLRDWGVDVGWIVSLANTLDESTGLSTSSSKALSYFVVSAGSVAVALAAVSRVLSRYVPWMRAPLDAALDVDNYFREFPRKAIPRARIFSRYVSVLKYVAGRGYDHIVVVAHSQGTVISTEVLRYLKEGTDTKRGSELQQALWDRLRDRIVMVTAGCPLRQLYAARFPLVYDWVLADHNGAFGPTASGIGAKRWVNIFATGDYVGRWLWTRHPGATEYPPSEIDEEVSNGASTYAPPQLPDLPDWRRLIEAHAETDISLGAGAHTRYFHISQKSVAEIVDAVVSEPNAA